MGIRPDLARNQFSLARLQIDEPVFGTFWPDRLMTVAWLIFGAVSKKPALFGYIRDRFKRVGLGNVGGKHLPRRQIDPNQDVWIDPRTIALCEQRPFPVRAYYRRKH